jgi:hypothetical protein
LLDVSLLLALDGQGQRQHAFFSRAGMGAVAGSRDLRPFWRLMMCVAGGFRKLLRSGDCLSGKEKEICDGKLVN